MVKLYNHVSKLRINIKQSEQYAFQNHVPRYNSRFPYSQLIRSDNSIMYYNLLLMFVDPDIVPKLPLEGQNSIT